MSKQWQAHKALARAILADQGQRRRLLAPGGAVVLGMTALGLWLIDGWLEREWLRFVLWWGVCGLMTLWLLLFALYEVLLGIRDSRK